MQNTIKIYTKCVYPSLTNIPYSSLELDQQTSFEIAATNTNFLRIEILNTKKTALKQNYLSKIDIFAYYLDKTVVFSQEKLKTKKSKDVCSNETFIKKLKKFLPKYLKNEINTVKSEILDNSDKKFLLIGQFYYKHNLLDTADFYIKESERIESLNSTDISLCNEIGLYILLNKEGVPDDHEINKKIHKIMKILQNNNEKKVELLLNVKEFVMPVDFIFLSQNINLNSLEYFAKIYFFVAAYKYFYEKQNIYSSVYYATLAYFSISDGFTGELKLHLKKFIFRNMQLNWRNVFINIFKKIDNLYCEELNILMDKIDLEKKNYKLSQITHLKFNLDVKFTGLDTLINYDTGFMHGYNEILHNKTIYFLNYVVMEILSENINEIEILELNGDSAKIDIIKKIKPNETINLNFTKSIKINKMGYNDKSGTHFYDFNEFNFIKVVPIYEYKILEMKKLNFGLLLEIETIDIYKKEPRFIGIGFEIDVCYEKDCKKIRINIKNLVCKEIIIMMQISDEVFKKYTFYENDFI